MKYLNIINVHTVLAKKENLSNALVTICLERGTIHHEYYSKLVVTCDETRLDWLTQCTNFSFLIHS